MPRHKDEQKRAAHAYLSSDKTVVQVAGEQGVGDTAIYNELNAMGKQPVRLKKDGTPWGKPTGPRAGRLSVVEEKGAEIVAAWKKNPNPEQVGSQLGVSANTVLKTVKAASYEVKRPGRPRKKITPTAGPKAP
jgi:hypothetical protein